MVSNPDKNITVEIAAPFFSHLGQISILRDDSPSFYYTNDIMMCSIFRAFRWRRVVDCKTTKSQFLTNFINSRISSLFAFRLGVEAARNWITFTLQFFPEAIYFSNIFFRHKLLRYIIQEYQFDGRYSCKWEIIFSTWMSNCWYFRITLMMEYLRLIVAENNSNERGLMR